MLATDDPVEETSSVSQYPVDSFYVINPENNPITLYVCSYDLKTIKIICNNNTLVEDIHDEIASRVDVRPTQIDIILGYDSWKSPIRAGEIRRITGRCSYTDIFVRLKKDPFANYEPFNVYVKTLTGKTLNIECKSDDYVGEVKEKINNQYRVPIDQQRIIWAGQELTDSIMIKRYGIREDVTLHLVLRLRGS